MNVVWFTDMNLFGLCFMYPDALPLDSQVCKVIRSIGRNAIS